MQSVSLPLDTSLSPGTLQVIVAADRRRRRAPLRRRRTTSNVEPLIPWLNAERRLGSEPSVVRSMASTSRTGAWCGHGGTTACRKSTSSNPATASSLPATALTRLPPVVANEVYSIELQGAP